MISEIQTVLPAHFPDKLQALFSHIPGAGELPPNTNRIGKIRIVSCEPFDGEPTLIVDPGKCGKGFVPGHMAAAGRTPIVLTDMRSEENTSELQSLTRISNATFC